MKSHQSLQHALAIGMVSIAGVYALPAQAQNAHNAELKKEFRIMHHEHLKSLRFDYRTSEAMNPGAEADATPPANVSFDAYGRQFNMDLESNEQLLNNLPSTQKKRLKQSMQMYKGRLNGMPGSWVRVNRIGNRVTGAMWDGHELYIMDNSDTVGKSMDESVGTNASTKPYNLVYKLSDTQTTAECAVEAQPATSMSGLVSELQTQAQALAQTNKKLDVAIVADAAFTQANSANPQAAVMARMNVVDGIYSEQVGVHLNIARIVALSSNGGMTSTSPSTLLDQFVNYTSSSSFNNPGIAHLFTGRELDGSIVGIAYIGVLCRKDVGVGLSQTNGAGIAGALTVAHEMGHNFGAPHDGQTGSACATAPTTFIMNPVLNGSTQFSDCSLQQMVPNIAGASCLTDNVPSIPSADVRAIIPVNPIKATVNSNLTAKVEVRNVGNAAASGSTAKITIPAGLVINQVSSTLGQCQINAQTINCNLGNLAVNNTATVSLNLKTSNTPGTVEGKVQVGASNDSNTANNTATFAINTTVIPPATTSGTIFQSNFNADNGGFAYLDDAFLSTKQPSYASGNRVVSASNGKLEVVLGGLDTKIIKGMSGGWRKSFTLAKPATVTLSFEYRVDQSAHYESNEWSDALLALDGKPIGLNGGSFLSRIVGDGDGGAPRSSGNVRVSITRGPLQAGTHSIILGGYNNQKTWANESSHVYFDNVNLVSKP